MKTKKVGTKWWHHMFSNKEYANLETYLPTKSFGGFTIIQFKINPRIFSIFAVENSMTSWFFVDIR